MNQNSIEEYFNTHSEEWIEGGYQTDGYNFPTAIERIEKTVGLLTQLLPNAGAQITDLGCGNGHLCGELAQLGYEVTGVDRSESMIRSATQMRDSMPVEQRSLVNLVHRDVLENALEPASADAVTALGVIGYLENDGLLFAEAARILRPSGILIVSCRNRLFNMVSISHHTAKEIDQGVAKDLVAEIMELYAEIPGEDASKFVQELAGASGRLASAMPPGSVSTSSGPSSEPDPIEARQQTPKGLLATAQTHSFEHISYFGIHPHLLMAGLSRSLPPHVFNILSSSLKALDHLPASLIWSSVFLGVFRKTSP